jgi:hypothetical protein
VWLLGETVADFGFLWLLGIGGGSGDCGRRDKPMSPKNLAAARGCCGVGENHRGGAGLRGRDFRGLGVIQFGYVFRRLPGMSPHMRGPVSTKYSMPNYPASKHKKTTEQRNQPTTGRR